MQVTEINEDHNHEVCKVHHIQLFVCLHDCYFMGVSLFTYQDIYDHLPRQRQLNQSEKKNAQELIKLKVNKKLPLSETTGKVVTLKDITNMQTSSQNPKNSSVEELVTRLKAIDGWLYFYPIMVIFVVNISGSTVEAYIDDHNTFSGLFFQDGIMKMVYAAYPEVLLVDATYKLNELRMPVYLLLVIDSNGQSEIVCVFVTHLETANAIREMVSSFKSHNSKWNLTKVVMSDKDFIERAVFSTEFPQATLLICLFHTLRSMKREVICDKLGLHPGERDNALEILTKLTYSKSEADYLQNYECLLDSRLQSVIDYYNDNWHPIRHQWVECFKGVNFTAGERTNNRLESINAKVKSVCSKYASLSTFFNQFFAVLSCL